MCSRLRYLLGLSEIRITNLTNSLGHLSCLSPEVPCGFASDAECSHRCAPVSSRASHRTATMVNRLSCLNTWLAHSGYPLRDGTSRSLPDRYGTCAMHRPDLPAWVVGVTAQGTVSPTRRDHHFGRRRVNPNGTATSRRAFSANHPHLHTPGAATAWASWLFAVADRYIMYR